MIATLAQTKEMLRYDGSDHDANITLAIKAASASIMRYVNYPKDDWEDSNFVPPDDVVVACIMYAGLILRNPSHAAGEDWQPGYMPSYVRNLCYPYRFPTALAGEGDEDYKKCLRCWTDNGI